jgi:cytosine deaminase
MPTDLLVTSARIAASAEPVDIAIAEGVITRIGPAGEGPPSGSANVIAAEGRVVVPGLVESHLHLDKALLGVPAGGSTLAEAIAETARRKARFTAADIRARALQVISWAVAAGTTAIRAHTEVDPSVGLLGVHTMAELADELADVLRLQVAVFPQEGLFVRPGTLALMRDALRLPGTVVGGCPYSEANADDARRHVDAVLDLAVEFGVPADLHLDLADSLSDSRFTLAAHVARATSERGLAGRVAIGHVTTLALEPADRRQRVIDALATAQVAVVTLPATDLYLSGRSDAGVVRRGLTPVRELWAAGVPTAVSSNNIRNAFTPTGRADLLDIAGLLARTIHLSDPADFDSVLTMTGAGGARLIDPERPSSLELGARADLVLLDSTDPGNVLTDQPVRLAVISGGRLVYQQERHVAWAPVARLLADAGSDDPVAVA